MTPLDQVSVQSQVMAAQYVRPYQRIAEVLRSELRSGRWRRGDRLPTLEQLAAEFGVAKNTVRNAVNLLREEGLIAPRGLYITDLGGDLYVPEPATTPERQPPIVTSLCSDAAQISGPVTRAKRVNLCCWATHSVARIDTDGHARALCAAQQHKRCSLAAQMRR